MPQKACRAAVLTESKTLSRYKISSKRKRHLFERPDFEAPSGHPDRSTSFQASSLVGYSISKPMTVPFSTRRLSFRTRNLNSHVPDNIRRFEHFL